MIQRQHTSRQMRKSLERLGKSMGSLRKNVGIFAFRWRVRKKVRAGDTLRLFLTDTVRQGAFGKTLHNFIYQVVKLQRVARYISIIHAQLGVFATQFDHLLGRSAAQTMFLSDVDKRVFMSKVTASVWAPRPTATAAQPRAGPVAARGGKAARSGSGGGRRRRRGERAAAEEAAAGAPAAELPALADGNSADRHGLQAGGPLEEAALAARRAQPEAARIPAGRAARREPRAQA